MRRVLGAGMLAFALAACGGGNSSSSTPAVQPNITGVQSTGITARIVGVGDSLTAGEQSNALLGASISPNPLGAASLYPFIPETQEHGYYARLWSQANAGADPSNPSISPLPLIAPPGLGQILVPATAGGFTSIVPSACTGPNAAGLTFSSALTVRLNPRATPLDVAIPGQTLHEAIAQIGPTGPCNTSTLPAEFQGLATLLASENTNFYPILGTFGSSVSQLQAAVSLRPTLAVVWLGSNDLLKYAFSNGALPATDPTTFLNDITNVIQSLQATGAKVAVSNLIDVLHAAYFTPVAAIPQVLASVGVPAAQIPALTAAIDTDLQSVGAGPNGYVTLSGLEKLEGALAAIQQGTAPATALGAAGLSAATGDVLVDAIAANVQNLNNEYNTSIATAVQKTGAALVDNHAFVASIVAAGGVSPLPSNPKCCSLAFGGGFFSNDGIHPSDTAYAILANNFIAAIDTAYGAGIPALSASQIATINATDLYSPH